MLSTTPSTPRCSGWTTRYGLYSPHFALPLPRDSASPPPSMTLRTRACTLPLRVRRSPLAARMTTH
eukprot:1584411-Pleurochrysis_carterae.AAC.1